MECIDYHNGIIKDYKKKIDDLEFRRGRCSFMLNFVEGDMDKINSFWAKISDYKKKAAELSNRCYHHRMLLKFIDGIIEKLDFLCIDIINISTREIEDGYYVDLDLKMDINENFKLVRVFYSGAFIEGNEISIPFKI